jgi:5'/3'-nucleotidase
MKPVRRILLTNDDGVDAPGMAVLRAIAGQLCDDVWVVAPVGNQSGAGHRFSLSIELELQQRGEQIFALDGTPADCVVAGLTHLLKDQKPDLVLSGVNRGHNIGDLIHCSGTVAGAREAALHNVLGVALSQAMDFSNPGEVEWGCSEARAVDIIDRLVARASSTEAYFNVNFPRCPPSHVSGTVLVPHQRFVSSPFEFYPSRNQGRHFVSILRSPDVLTNGADMMSLLDNNAITITPLMLQQTDFEAIERLQEHF